MVALEGLLVSASASESKRVVVDSVSAMMSAVGMFVARDVSFMKYSRCFSVRSGMPLSTLFIRRMLKDPGGGVGLGLGAMVGALVGGVGDGVGDGVGGVGVDVGALVGDADGAEVGATDGTWAENKESSPNTNTGYQPNI